MLTVGDGAGRSRINDFKPIKPVNQNPPKSPQAIEQRVSAASDNHLRDVARTVAQVVTLPAKAPTKAPNSPAAPQTPTKAPTAPAAPPKPQPISYERSDKAVDYMFNEMKTNINSPTVRNIKAQLEYADYLTNPKGWKEKIGAALAHAGGDNAGNHIQAALVEWGLKVRPKGDWDHKRNDKLPTELGLTKGDYHFPIRGDNKHEVYYDVWSNVHYGYVGRAAGFDGKTLQQGAAVADGVAGRNDKVDETTVQIGIDMWDKYGANLTKEQFHQEMVNRLPDIIEAQKDPSYVEQNKNGWRHVTGIQNGR